MSRDRRTRGDSHAGKMHSFSEKTKRTLDSVVQLHVHLEGPSSFDSYLKTYFNNYTRLAKSFLGMSSLWMGPDHLVYVRGRGFLQAFSEEYLRFRFKDIQAIVLTHTSRAGLAILYLLGALLFAGIIALILLLRGEEPMGLMAIVSLSAMALPFLIFSLLLLRHLILGPTCRCFVQTSLKKNRIRPLNRIHATRQCIESISKTLNQAQQDLSFPHPSPSEPIKPASPPKDLAGLKVPFLVLPTFTLFALFSVSVLGALHLGGAVFSAISLLLAALGALGLIAALVSCIRFATPESIRTSMWVLLAEVLFLLGGGVVYYVYVSSIDPVYTLELTGPIEAFAGAGSVGGLGFYLYFTVLSVGVFCVSLLGVFQVQMWKGRINKINPQI